jgi:hypothetical protein
LDDKIYMSPEAFGFSSKFILKIILELHVVKLDSGCITHTSYHVERTGELEYFGSVDEINISGTNIY